ncbi:MAG: metal ABC transporter permease [Elusimicrobia bacterium]|nr:metal ABC transporter permease [Elusimicrobiota bacterium]
MTPLLLASLLGGLSAFGGFYLSYTRDLPLGPVVVCLACAVYALSSAARLVVPRSS